MPHLDAAYTLARWLVRNDHDAEDVVQEALVKAMRFVDDFQGINGRGWLLAILRNTAFTWHQRNRPTDLEGLADDVVSLAKYPDGPDEALLRAEHSEILRVALEKLPYAFREVIVLRELDGLSYKSISEIIDAPIGTVMSRLARGRSQLAHALPRAADKEG